MVKKGGEKMKIKFWTTLLVLSFLLVLTVGIGFSLSQPVAPPPPTQLPVLGEKQPKEECTTIQSGELTYSAGHYLDEENLATGYDAYGYNYQAHEFKGSYANVYLGRDGFPSYEGNTESYLEENPTAANKWYWPYRDDELLMKWDNNWLASKDCDGDGLLDRHFGFDTYVGSGAWETNHQTGSYEMDGKACKWNYFVKIVAAPEDAIQEDGVWRTSNGAEIGPVIWGSFAITQQVYNDPCEGAHGVEYLSPVGPGFGKWK
jgi:hypothetical protein